MDVTDWGHSAKDQRGRNRDRPRWTHHRCRSALRYFNPQRRARHRLHRQVPPAGLVDGFAGMNSQGQANANLYMGVTTVVASSDDRRGLIDFNANPSPHLYPIDSIGTTDNWSLLAKRPEWAA